MKRILALTVLIALLVGSLVACKKKYKPVESSAEESRVVMTMTLNGKTYDVKYELYRAFFLTYKSEIDGGDDSVWSGESKEEYIALINERIIDEVAEIYAVFALCDVNGFDLYSDDVEDKITEMIKVSVEGGTYGDEAYEGFGGDYDAYLASLTAIYHNYSTAVLLMRYSIGRGMLDSHYIGGSRYDDNTGVLTDGKIEYTIDTIRNYYYSDAASLMLSTYIPEGVSYTPREYAEEVRLEIVNEAKFGAEAVKILMINRGTPTAITELENGVLYGRYSLARDYNALAEAAYLMKEGEVSEVIPTYAPNDGKRYYIMYKMEKSEEFFENFYSQIVEVYLYDTIGLMVDTAGDVLAGSVTYTDAYNDIIHGEVRM